MSDHDDNTPPEEKSRKSRSEKVVPISPGPPDTESPPVEAYGSDPEARAAAAQQATATKTGIIKQFPDKKLINGLPPDYIRAASLWEKSFERYWLVENLIERGRVYELFGKYKSGKTLAAIDMVCHLAAGMPTWGGRRTAAVFVIWIAGEAVEDVEQRIAAWLRQHHVKQDIPLYIRVKPAYLDKSEFSQRVGWEVAELQLLNPELVPLIVIDTVARNISPGCDENSNQGLGAFINNVIDHVVRPHNATAICVHHPGHGDSERGRGHSSFPGAVDGIIKVAMDKSSGASIITVTTSEMRNTNGSDAFSFRIETQELPGHDNFGNPVEAPVLRYLADHQPAPVLGRNEEQAVRILRDMLHTNGDAGVTVMAWRQAFKDWFKDNSRAKDRETANRSANTAAKNMIATLHKMNVIRYRGPMSAPFVFLPALQEDNE